MTASAVVQLSYQFKALQKELWDLVCMNDVYIEELYRCLWCHKPYGSKNDVHYIAPAIAQCGHVGVGNDCGFDLNIRYRKPDEGCHLGKKKERCFTCRFGHRVSCVESIGNLKLLVTELDNLLVTLA